MNDQAANAPDRASAGQAAPSGGQPRSGETAVRTVIVIDPRDLSPTLKNALMTVREYSPSRVRNGYGRQESFVTLRAAEQLRLKGLARVELSGTRGNRLLLTGAGFNTWSVMVARQDRRKQA